MILHSLMSCSFCVCVQRPSCCEIPKLFDALNLMHFVSIFCPVLDTVLIRVSYLSLIMKRALCFCLECLSPSKPLSIGIVYHKIDYFAMDYEAC